MTPPIVLLALGSWEQHGAHLPFDTDTVIIESVVDAAIRSVDPENTQFSVVPTIGVTASDEHNGFAGTLSIGTNALSDAVVSIARSASWARGICIVNGHGGNSALTAMMNREIRLKYGLQTFLAHPHMPADQGGSSAVSELGMGVHGGMDETSVMLHLRPELVDMSLAVRRVPEKLAENEQVRSGGRVAFGWLSNDFFPEGHIGDPTDATAELGAQMVRSATDSLGGALREISRFDFGR